MLEAMKSSSVLGEDYMEKRKDSPRNGFPRVYFHLYQLVEAVKISVHLTFWWSILKCMHLKEKKTSPENPKEEKAPI